MIDRAQKTNRFNWHLNAKILLFSALMLPALMGLGFWQMERADEKQQLVDRYAKNQQLPPIVEVQDIMADGDHQYRRAWIKATADNQRIIILDNRVKNGRPGYEILQAASIFGENKKLLINRGWVPASLDRSILPSIAPISAEMQLRGNLYRRLKGGYQLDDGVTVVKSWPSRIGWVSVARAEELFGEKFFPYQLRLDQDSQGALETGWVTVAVQPEKHTGYAVQWFAMAITLLILTLIANSNLVSWLQIKFSSKSND
jgi:surfeit locus 1 family protein